MFLNLEISRDRSVSRRYVHVLIYLSSQFKGRGVRALCACAVCSRRWERWLSVCGASESPAGLQQSHRLLPLQVIWGRSRDVALTVGSQVLSSVPHTPALASVQERSPKIPFIQLIIQSRSRGRWHLLPYEGFVYFSLRINNLEPGRAWNIIWLNLVSIDEDSEAPKRLTDLTEVTLIRTGDSRNNIHLSLNSRTPQSLQCDTWLL